MCNVKQSLGVPPQVFEERDKEVANDGKRMGSVVVFLFFSEGEAEVKLLMCCSERLRRERVGKGKGVDGSSRAARDCMQDPFLCHFFFACG